MNKNGFLLFQYFSCSFLLCMNILCAASSDAGTDRKIHIVYMGSLQEGQYSPASQHLSMLQEVVGSRPSSSLENILLRSYKRSFNGFAAKITDNERQKLSKMKGVVSVFPSRTLHIQTTRSWDFMGFNESASRKRDVESDIIVGVLDTGIWPESQSFSDEGFGPPPKKWKGECRGGQNFTCNNKIIGARDYSAIYDSKLIKPVTTTSARDDVGHGSHTASTAAGNYVKDASFYELAKGTARGGVPSARIAAYKICNSDGCSEEAILSAFDDAIADGVDVITISIGGEAAQFSEDSIAIGAFHAMAKGILTVNSAGNSGPSLSSVSSVSPWLFSVAASSTDRLIVDNVLLGNGKTVKGISINSFSLGGKTFPLVHGKEVSDSISNCTAEELEQCVVTCLDKSKMKGKIVLCDEDGEFYQGHQYGAAGTILKSDGIEKLSRIVAYPDTTVTREDFDAILSYKNSTKNPVAEILKSESIKDYAAPVVAFFSSRGPNSIEPEILKPDITAPGLYILAAYSPVGPVSDDFSDERHVEYNLLSGTSMSCPHVAGVSAYVKTFHPDWSPSAIKSAIMTTAWTMDPSKHKDGEFAYGSGHINPLQAINPGLVYDALKPDYIKMLCSEGLSDEKLRSISGDNNTCPKGSHKGSAKDLNYPSMSARIVPRTAFNVTFYRTVTNVGLPDSVYNAKTSQPANVSIEVEPAVLSFKSLNENKSFMVTVSGRSDVEFLSASLVWSDGKHSVRSPIVLYSSNK